MSLLNWSSYGSKQENQLHSTQIMRGRFFYVRQENKDANATNTLNNAVKDHFHFSIHAAGMDNQAIDRLQFYRIEQKKQVLGHSESNVGWLV